MAERKKPRCSCALLLVAFVICFALASVDAFWWEPRHPQLTTYDVALPGLPAELDGFRIFQISDPHRRSEDFDPVIRRAVELANSVNPDVVVLTGDFAGRDPENYEPCMALLSEARGRLGSYAVLGNHDHWAGRDHTEQALRAHNLPLLDNSNVELAPGLWLAGIDDEWAGKPDEARTLAGIPAAQALVVLAHNPKSSKRFLKVPCLIISGHTHGGQVQLPPIPRNKLPGLLGSKWVEGWYREGKALLYVNRGLGMVTPTVRFLCRSEVTLYVLHPGQGEPQVQQ